MIERLSRTRRNIALLVLAAAVVWFAWTIRTVLNPVLLGYLCAFILAPVVKWIEQRGFGRRTAVNLTFVGGFLLAGIITLLLALQVFMVARRVASEARLPPVAVGEAEAGGAAGSQAEDDKPSLEARVQQKVNAFAQLLEEWGIPVPVEEIKVDFEDLRGVAREFLETNTEETRAAGAKAFGFITRFVGKLFALAGLFALLPLYAYYFLFVGKDVETFFQRYLPKKDRERITRVVSEIGSIVASFFRGRLGVCFIKGLILSIGLWFAGIEFAFLLGMLSGFLSIIPFFGPFLGFLLAFASGIVFGGDHQIVSALVRTGVVFLIGETIEGYVLVPKVLGDSLGLHPLVVFVALLAGGAALGMLGVIVALPLTASLVILFKEFVLPALRDWADEDAKPTPGETGS